MLFATATKGPSPISDACHCCAMQTHPCQNGSYKRGCGLLGCEGKARGKSQANNMRLSLLLEKKGTEATGHVISSIIRFRFATLYLLGLHSLSTAFQGG